MKDEGFCHTPALQSEIILAESTTNWNSYASKGKPDNTRVEGYLTTKTRLPRIAASSKPEERIGSRVVAHQENPVTPRTRNRPNAPGEGPEATHEHRGREREPEHRRDTGEKNRRGRPGQSGNRTPGPVRPFHLSLFGCRFLGRSPFFNARFWGRRPTRVNLHPVYTPGGSSNQRFFVLASNQRSCTSLAQRRSPQTRGSCACLKPGVLHIVGSTSITSNQRILCLPQTRGLAHRWLNVDHFKPEDLVLASNQRSCTSLAQPA